MAHHFDPSLEAQLSHRRTALQQEAHHHRLGRLARRPRPRLSRPDPAAGRRDAG